MLWTYSKTYFLKSSNNSNIFPQNFVSFFKNPAIKIKSTTFTRKHTKFLRENINKKIEHSFFTHKKNINYGQKTFNTIWLKKESYIHYLPITLTIKKTIITTKLAHKKQFIFLIKELICGLQKTLPILFKEHIAFKEFFISNKKYNLKEQKNIALFYQDYLGYFFFNTSWPLSTQVYLSTPAKLQIYNKINLLIVYTFICLSITKTPILFNFNNFLALFTLVVKNTTQKTKLYKNNSNIKLRASFYGNLNFNKSYRKLNKTTPNIYIWKNTNNVKQQINTNSTVRKHYFPIITNRIFNFKHTNIIKQPKIRYTITPKILYLLLRLEEKIELYKKNSDTINLANELLKFYNAINHFIVIKQNKSISTSLVLTNLLEILKLRNTDWKLVVLNAIKIWLNEPTKKTTIKTQIFFSNLWAKITNKADTFTRKNSENIRPQIDYKINAKTNLLEPIKKQKNYQKPLNINKFLTHEKLTLTHTKYNFKNNKDIITRMTNHTTKIFYINALSLTKYAFNLERILEKKEKRSPTTFLQNIDRDLINKYKYIAIYIKDLIRICFIGMYLKKANLIAQFIAFQLGKLPRNRKETSFIKFIIKVVKTFAAEREEILGLRIKFSGRVNRWRRTKAIIGERGVIPLHTINNQIEYGTAHAVNRKGSAGIKIWIHYNNSFNIVLKQSILKYFTYSKRLIIKKKALKTITFLK